MSLIVAAIGNNCSMRESVSMTEARQSGTQDPSHCYQTRAIPSPKHSYFGAWACVDSHHLSHLAKLAMTVDVDLLIDVGLL
jgi:hypothetical protein